MRKLRISIIILSFLGLITANTFALSIQVDSFSIFPDDIHTAGNGSVVGGTSYGSTTMGGISVATFAEANSSSYSCAMWPWCMWYDYARAEAIYGFRMRAHLIGDPGEESEIIADWKFFTQPLLYAAPDGILTPSGNTASAVNQMDVYMSGINKDGYFNRYEYGSFHDEQSIVWMGAGGDSVTETGSVSLGVFPANNGSYYCDIVGGLYIESESFSNPHGTAVSSMFSTLNFTLTPNPIPEPAAIWLLGSGLLGLVGLRRKKG